MRNFHTQISVEKWFVQTLFVMRAPSTDHSQSLCCINKPIELYLECNRPMKGRVGLAWYAVLELPMAQLYMDKQSDHQLTKNKCKLKKEQHGLMKLGVVRHGTLATQPIR